MALRTKFTDIMGIDNPIVSAPMGGSAGGALAAAVSNGGGLGLIGGGRSDFEWIGPQIECAAGVLVGTRFNAREEALVDSEVVKAVLNGHGEDTERSGVFDIARGVAWPARYTGRTIRNEFLEQWRGREVDLTADAAARAEYRRAEQSGDMRVVPVWAGEAIDLITEFVSATDVVRTMVSDAEGALRRILHET